MLGYTERNRILRNVRKRITTATTTKNATYKYKLCENPMKQKKNETTHTVGPKYYSPYVYTQHALHTFMYVFVCEIIKSRELLYWLFSVTCYFVFSFFFRLALAKCTHRAKMPANAFIHIWNTSKENSNEMKAI